MKAIVHKSRIPPDQIYLIRRLQEKHFDPIWHAHSEYQLFVVLEGTGTRFIGDNIHTFGPGELIFTGPHLPHLWRNDEAYFDSKSSLKTDGIVIYFNENFLGEHFMNKQEMVALKKMFTRSMRGLEFYGEKKWLVVQMMRQLLQLKGMKSVIHFLEILELLAGSKEYRYISSRKYEDILDESETDRLNVIYAYILKNFRRKLSVEELANLVHMTPTSFSRYFTSRNNKPFSRFVSEIRIREACRLLIETEYSIADICYECGFNTLSNFNKQFREIMMKKPGQYKKEFMSI